MRDLTEAPGVGLAASGTAAIVAMLIANLTMMTKNQTKIVKIVAKAAVRNKISEN